MFDFSANKITIIVAVIALFLLWRATQGSSGKEFFQPLRPNPHHDPNMHNKRTTLLARLP
jgi:hypothetical protein